MNSMATFPISSTRTEDASARDLDRVSILVVDDLPEKLLAYEAILEDLGQELVKVRSGEEALKLVLKQEFAVILLDVNMPGMDGFETASLIRQRKRSSHTPIIFLTAFTDEVRMAQGYASGAVDYLPTPVVPETLKAKVKVFIELSQMRKRAALQAQEHAMRQAAEASAKHSDFLVTASEIFMRAQQEQEILHAVIRLPIPFLADIAVLYMSSKEEEKNWVGWTSSYAEKTVYSHKGSDMHSVFPQLREVIAQVIESDQPQTINHLPLSSLTPAPVGNVPFLVPEINATHFNALVVPFTLRSMPCGALVLARSGAHSRYQLADELLSTDFISRADASLDNVMLLKRIQEADQRKNEFLAMLAHELRNPLAPMRNALYVMRQSQDGNLRRQAEETIDRQLNHMVHLVDDLMDVSRITQGKIELRKERITLNDALNQAMETAQVLIGQRSQSIELQLPEIPIYLHADFSRISQIFVNLLNNAAKYTDNGGHIQVVAELLNDKAVVKIKDNGIGIPEDMRSRIFDMFLQVDSSLERAQGGLGIGLTLVKNLVEMHGGTIEVISEGAHKGSEFIVTLPAIEAPIKTQTTTLVKEATPEKMAGTLNILIVDDNIESAQTLGWMVEIFGHKPTLSHTGQDALGMVNALAPNVVLLDIGLPGMNGYEVCKAMRQLPDMANTTFIAQTGWGQAEHRERSKEAGFDFHLVKPVDIVELENLITKIAQDLRRAQ